MANPRTILRHLRHLVGPPVRGELSDRQLLARFVECREEAAFAALVSRHGPLVLGVAWRILHHVQDAEDVFQATFLVLARKAGTIYWQESVANWLYEVAYRLAMKTRAQSAHRRARDMQTGTMARPEVSTGPVWREVVVDEELHQLSASYRLPLVLCYLQDRTRDQAAQQLQCSLRTLDRRLERGREILRARLARRGITASAALAGLGPAAPSRALADVVVQTASAFAAGSVTPGTIPASVLAMAEGMLKGTSAVGLGLATLLGASLVVAAAAALAFPTARSDLAAAVGSNEPRSGSEPGPVPGDAASKSKDPAEPPRTVTLQGAVVDAAGRPVAGAAVVLREQPISRNGSTGQPTKTRNVARTTTDEQGGFAFADAMLPPPDTMRRQGFPLDVIVLAKGHGLGWRHIEVPPGRAVRLALPAEAQLEGRVVDGNGKAVAGIAVKVREIADLDYEIRPALGSRGYLDLQWSELALSATSDARGALCCAACLLRCERPS
jgi:RNA polymerase sigma factor (sigma-70 family)